MIDNVSSHGNDVDVNPMVWKNLKQLWQSIDRRQWYFILFMLLIITIITLSPFTLLLFKSKSMTWTGLLSFAPGDRNVYFSYINQIKAGQTLLFNHFTTEHQTLGVFNIVWWTIGNIAKILPFSTAIIFQVSRFITIPGLLISLYLFIAYFFPNKLMRYWAFFLAVFGSGVGAYAASLVNTSTTTKGQLIYLRASDLWMSESTVFNNLLYSPHLILATTLILLIFLLILFAYQTNQYRYSILAGVCSLFLFNFHPYHLPTIYLVPLVYGLFITFNLTPKNRHPEPACSSSLSLGVEDRNQRLSFGVGRFSEGLPFSWIKHYLILGIISCPSILYHFYLITDPIVGIRSSQNITLSSPIIYYILGFGVFTFLGLYGIYAAFKKNLNKSFYFLFFWIIIAACLLYLPGWAFQRRATQGLIVPLAMFSVMAMHYFFNQHQTFKKRLFSLPVYPAIIVTLFFIPTTIFNSGRDIQVLLDDNTAAIFPIAKMQAIRRIDQLQKNNIIGNETNMNFIVGNTSKTVFLGHDHETANSKIKKGFLYPLLNNELSESAAIEVFQRFGINYLYWDQLDQSNESGYLPDQQPYLKKIFDNGYGAIYEFTAP